MRFILASQINFNIFAVNIICLGIAMNSFSLAAVGGLIILLCGLLEGDKVLLSSIIPLLLVCLFLLKFSVSFINTHAYHIYFVPLFVTVCIALSMSTNIWNKNISFDLCIILYFIYVIYIFVEINFFENLLFRSLTVSSLYEHFYISPNRLVIGTGLIVFLLQNSRQVYLFRLLYQFLLILLVIGFASRLALLILIFNTWKVFTTSTIFVKYIFLLIASLFIYLLSSRLGVIYDTFYWRIYNGVFGNDNRIKSLADRTHCMDDTLSVFFGNPVCMTRVVTDYELDNMFSFIYYSSGVLGLGFFLAIIVLMIYQLKTHIASVMLFTAWLALVYSIDESVGKLEFLNPILLWIVLFFRNNDLKKKRYANLQSR